MRQEVYVKFAEALQARKAADRAQHVYTKFAEALQARRMQKQALSPAPASRLLRALLKLRIKASPKVNASNWSKYDPRRLFTTKRVTPTTATNFKPGTTAGGVAHGVSGAYRAGAYQPGAGGGAIRAFGELERLGGFNTTTRLSPGKILAALGILGGGGALASKAVKGPKEAPTAPVPPPRSGMRPAPEQEEGGAPAGGGASSDVWGRITSDPRVQRAIAGIAAAGATARDTTQDLMARIQAAHGLHVGLAGAGGLAAGGLGGYALGSRAGQGGKKKKRESGKDVLN